MMMIMEYALCGAGNALYDLYDLYSSFEGKQKLFSERRKNGFWTNFCVDN
jgi:hypothetical protein